MGEESEDGAIPGLVADRCQSAARPPRPASIRPRRRVPLVRVGSRERGRGGGERPGRFGHWAESEAAARWAPLPFF